MWFAQLGLAVNNLVWPVLFNVFAIRGEEYRDPRVLLTGLDHLNALGARHLVGAHGPPLSGADEIKAVVTDYRDAIQFLWDQTVRGMNKGLSADELTQFVQLPKRFERTYFTQQFYGLVEHHVRQIHTGLIGWFDGVESSLFPLPPLQRAQRLIAGFGGRDAVRRQALDSEIRFEFDDGAIAGLRLRRGVAVPTTGDRADVVLALSATTWSQVLAGRQTLDAAQAGGHIVPRKGTWAQARAMLGCFDHPCLAT